MTTPEDPRLLLAIGTTGSGKSTLVGRLIDRSGFSMLSADTTRGPRDSDLPGEFNYLTDEEFDALDPDDMMYVAQHGSSSRQNQAPRYTLLRSVVKSAIEDTPALYTRPLAPQSAGLVLSEFGQAAVKVIYLPTPHITETERRIVQRGDDPSLLEARMANEAGWHEIAKQTPGIHIARGHTKYSLHMEALRLMGLNPHELE